jgi:hypothetical protein
MSAYVSGNKNNNNEEGVFPDDTVDPFDNPRIEYLSEYLHRTQGKALGVVTLLMSLMQPQRAMQCTPAIGVQAQGSLINSWMIVTCRVCRC